MASNGMPMALERTIRSTSSNTSILYFSLNGSKVWIYCSMFLPPNNMKNNTMMATKRLMNKSLTPLITFWPIVDTCVTTNVMLCSDRRSKPVFSSIKSITFPAGRMTASASR